MRGLAILLATLGISITLACLPSGRTPIPWGLAPALAAPAQAVAVSPASATMAASAASADDTFGWRDYPDPDLATQTRPPLWQAALVVIFKLGIVVALIYVVLFGYKRLLGVRSAGVLGSRVRIVESTRLAGTQSLIVVEAHDRYLLLGSNGAGLLEKLMEWPAGEVPPTPEEAAFTLAMGRAEAQRAVPASGQGSPGADDFDDIVDSTLRQVIAPPHEGSV